MNPNNGEMTLDQAKETLQFQAEIMQQQTQEIGSLNTEKITLLVSNQRKDKKIKELSDALQGMLDATKEDKEIPEDKENKTQKGAN